MDVIKIKRGGTSSAVSSTTTAASKRKSASLPNETVEYLKAWMMSPEHIAHPYPTEAEKVKIMNETGLEIKQLTNWFVNNRKRYWKPRVEARLRQVKVQNKVVAPRQSSLLPLISSPSRKVSSDGVQKAAVVSPKRDSLPAPTVPSKTIFPLLRTISEQNSVVSLADLVSSDDEAEANVTISKNTAEATLKTESVNVHILRPFLGSQTPELSDVTVLDNIPVERVLRTFENCDIAYPLGAKSQSRRDAEIVRVKKDCLSLYLAGEATNRVVVNSKKRPAVHVVAPDGFPDLLPRHKFRRQSVELWKEACLTANHVYDGNLPSLEEATQLFGYTSS